jgi:hypothetical protein
MNTSNNKNIEFHKFHLLAQKYKNVTDYDKKKKFEKIKQNLDKTTQLRYSSINYSEKSNEDQLTKFSTYSEHELIRLNYKKFISLDPKSFENLLQYCDSSCLSILYNSNQNIRKNISTILYSIAETVVAKYSHIYKDYIPPKDKKLSIKHHYRKFISELNINITIKAKISSTQLIRKTVSVGYISAYYNEKEGFKNIFIFDVYKDEPLTFWIMREYTRV